MDRRFLLTYASGTSATFDWFESENELEEFIKDNRITKNFIFEKLEILDARDLTD